MGLEVFTRSAGVGPRPVWPPLGLQGFRKQPRPMNWLQWPTTASSARHGPLDDHKTKIDTLKEILPSSHQNQQEPPLVLPSGQEWMAIVLTPQTVAGTPGQPQPHEKMDPRSYPEGQQWPMVQSFFPRIALLPGTSFIAISESMSPKLLISHLSL